MTGHRSSRRRVCYGLLAFAHWHGWEICVAAALGGIGIGLAFAAMANAIVHSVPPKQTSMASGMNFLVRTLAAFGTPVAATIIAASTDGRHLRVLVAHRGDGR